MAAKALGSTVWAIPEGYIPTWSNGPEPEMLSHETICVLNTGTSDAQLRITIFFADRDPVGPYEQVVEARRTKHIRLNDLQPEIPKGTDYATLVESDHPIIVQYTRLDSRQAENALFSCMGYSG